jgi:hypothetical protein
MSYAPATFQDLFTAPWVAAWGSIAGAALGAYLAIYFSGVIQQRRERAAAKHFSNLLVAVVERVVFQGMTLVHNLEGKDHQYIENSLRGLIRLEEQLERFSPFTDLADYDKIQSMLDLEIQLQIVTGHQHLLEQQRARHRPDPHTFDQQHPTLRDLSLIRADLAVLLEMCRRTKATLQGKAIVDDWPGDETPAAKV